MRLQNRVETFLSNADYITFVVGDTDAVISFLFDTGKIHMISEEKNCRDLLKYFQGRKTKFVMITDNGRPAVSFVDVDTADTLNIEGPKFIAANIHRFFAAEVPNDRLFKLLIIGNSRDGNTMLLPEIFKKNELIEIYGYLVTDNRTIYK